MGEKQTKPFQLSFNGLLKVDFQGPGIHLTQVTPTSCSWAHSVLASQSTTIERYGVGSTAMACCTRR